uniref:NADH-ubiquinone oxidoreductase chain 2 n=1 Tax=Naupactus xanthographus TaxID=114905 RepID=D8WKQ0_NAUXA|nr:NADH dehydrogenase subunit 2 [Naupactus xanthographus]ACZ58583.1 NADH dehydrogenase subunit 2 [Naupactus xanthographus]
MVKLYKIMFFISMISGTFIAISSYSWFSSWIGLEINLLSFIVLLKNNKNKFPSEAALKYFIAQAMGSSMFLFSITMFLSSKNSLSSELSMIELIFMSTALLLKMGAAPFHFWYPEVMSGLNWSNALILLTTQKIAPLFLLSYNIKLYTLFFSSIIILSSIIGGLQGLNQMCMRKIMAYSSMNHMSWLIASIMNSTSISIIYFSIYSIISMSIILMLNKYNIFYINQISNIFNQNKKIKFIFMMNFLSLGGLPPFLGFLPKWLTINCMIENNHFTLAILLIIFSLISLYIYLRLTISTFTLYSSESLVSSFNKINLIQSIFSFISLFSLIFCSLIYNF